MSKFSHQSSGVLFAFAGEIGAHSNWRFIYFVSYHY